MAKASFLKIFKLPYTVSVLSLVLPTYNESANLPVLLPKIEEALKSLPYEILIVDDDSPDRTWETALTYAKSHPAVRVLRRIGRRGLSSAVIEGWLAASGDILAVMDADGQHDVSVLSKLAAAVSSGSGIAIGSRYVEGGSVGNWDERRFALSRYATRLAQSLCKVKVADPMSGFFALSRSVFQAALPQLNPKGFKILLDVLLHVPSTTRVTELPFAFGLRHAGESKLSCRVQVEFLEYLYEAVCGRYVPLSLVKFAVVGFLGVFVNLLFYRITQFLIGATSTDLLVVSPPLVVGIEAAIIFNFLLHNHWTFSQVQLRGLRAVQGFLLFNIACVFGALANYAVTSHLYQQGAPEVSSVLGGAFIGMIWNYTMSRLLTWKV